MIILNGAMGEGGGQILRTALTLSAITGQPFHIRDIRANRPKPGLMRQHLAAVQATVMICDAHTEGASLGSQTLTFTPGKMKGGDYQLAIGTAGSCTLVLQTLLPALLTADSPSTIALSGGTHNPMAPPAQFLQRAYNRVLKRMGADIDIELHRFGFYPAGGGEISATVRPCPQLIPVNLYTRGEPIAAYAESFVANVPASVAKRELGCIGAGMNWDTAQLQSHVLPADQGPGNALLLTLEYEHITEVFCAFGEKSVRAEDIAKRVVREARDYMASSGAVGEHLADQLMVPLALAGAGSFTTHRVSEHAKTNAAVIEQFLPVRFSFRADNGINTCTVEQR